MRPELVQQFADLVRGIAGQTGMTAQIIRATTMQCESGAMKDGAYRDAESQRDRAPRAGEDSGQMYRDQHLERAKRHVVNASLTAD